MEIENILSYDTIKLVLTKRQIPATDFLAYTSKYIEVDQAHSNYARVQGMVRNFKVTATPKCIKIEGSVAKFVHGDNFRSVTLKDMEQTLQNLSSTLHLPLDQAILSRVDVGCNVKVDHFPELYFDYLGTLPKFSRRICGNSSLYYENRTCTMLFYNKIKEEVMRNPLFSGGWGFENVIRYEVRLVRAGVRSLLKSEPNPTGAALYNPTFYQALCANAADLYASIVKINSSPLSFLFEDVGNATDFLDRCVCYANRHIDLEGELKRRFRNREQASPNDVAKHYQLRRRIKKALARAGEFCHTQQLEKELDQKIRQVFQAPALSVT